MQGGGDSVNTAKRKDKQKEIAKLHEKTFRAWINKQLKKNNLHINNLFTDLNDGILLIKIFETLSGKTCAQKPTPNPKMEIQKLENITMGLEFGKTLFPISMIQSKDILDAEKNPKLLLGLVWQMILHFQVLGDSDSADKKSQVEKQRGAKEKLLKWCQDQTKGHANIDITDLASKSWGDGMGFCALVHAYDPSLIDYNSLNPANKKENLTLAFSVAEKHLDIPQFLDVDDVLNPDNAPDEQCYITYLSEFPLAFLHKASKDLETGAARLKEEEARRKEDEARRNEEEARRREEDARRKEEEDRKRRDDEERARKEEDERRKREDDERRKREEDERRKKEEDDRRREEEERRRREEEEARLKAEKKAKKAAEKAEAERRAKEEEERRRKDAELNAEDEEKKRREAEKAFEEERERMRKENEAIRNQLEAVKKKLIGKIGVTVVEARGLPKSDHMGNKSDPYCVLFLERQKEKTRTVKKTLNPKWQADFEFYVSDINASLEVSVFDWNRIFSDELLGKTTIPVRELKDGTTEDKWYPLTGKEGKKKDAKESAGEIRLILTYKLER